LLSVVVHPADVQDRDGARQVLRTARRLFPFIDRIFADAGYQGPKMAKGVADTGCWTIDIVKRSDAHRFVVLPGSSNAPSPGSAAIVGLRATSSATLAPLPPSSASP
jgi:NAD(P)-dependent dehydrogenase (short-subunit alcohol dehydrogenase family)